MSTPLRQAAAALITTVESQAKARRSGGMGERIMAELQLAAWCERVSRLLNKPPFTTAPGLEPGDTVTFNGEEIGR